MYTHSAWAYKKAGSASHSPYTLSSFVIFTLADSQQYVHSISTIHPVLCSDCMCIRSPQSILSSVLGTLPAASPSITTIQLKTQYGSMRIRLEPSWSLESVEYVRQLALDPGLATQACEFYRAEPGFLLQVICGSGLRWLRRGLTFSQVVCGFYCLQ